MIKLAHDIIRDQIRKYSAGHKTPEQIDRALYRGLLDFFNSAPAEQASHRYLEEASYDVAATNSFALPGNFSREANIFSVVGSKKHEGVILTEEEFMDRIDSVLLGPDVQHPIARIIGGRIEFYPAEAGNYILSYYRTPKMPKYGYTVSGREFVFDPSASEELDVNESAINPVISGALRYLGISLKEENLMMDGN